MRGKPRLYINNKMNQNILAHNQDSGCYIKETKEVKYQNKYSLYSILLS